MYRFKCTLSLIILFGLSSLSAGGNEGKESLSSDPQSMFIHMVMTGAIRTAAPLTVRGAAWCLSNRSSYDNVASSSQPNGASSVMKRLIGSTCTGLKIMLLSPVGYVADKVVGVVIGTTALVVPVAVWWKIKTDAEILRELQRCGKYENETFSQNLSQVTNIRTELKAAEKTVDTLSALTTAATNNALRQRNLLRGGFDNLSTSLLSTEKNLDLQMTTLEQAVSREHAEQKIKMKELANSTREASSLIRSINLSVDRIDTTATTLSKAILDNTTMVSSNRRELKRLLQLMDTSDSVLQRQQFAKNGEENNDQQGDGASD
jgi:hypothetical protein